MSAVKYARENQLVVAIRGGGHNIAGHAVCDGGLMIDLSTMKEVRVDAPARRAFVQPGATLFDVDGEGELALRFAVKIAGPINGAAIIN